MVILETPHKKKSATITTVLMILVLLLILFFGMSYLDPPEESGIAVNFGTTNVGSGNVQPTEPIKSNSAPTEPEEEVEPQEQPVEETESEAPKEEAKTEEVLTQESEESIKIKQQEEAERKAREAEEAAKAEAERVAKEKREAEEKLKREQDEKRRKLDELMNGVKNADGSAEGGEGDDNKPGDKGNPNGDPYAKSYFGAPGSGNGGAGGYGLNGRSKTDNDVFQQECNEAGRVVVEIVVDRSGKVIKARPGVRGTTNNAQCLLEPAKRTAMSYKWNPDANAPETQIGFVVVNFSLGQ